MDSATPAARGFVLTPFSCLSPACWLTVQAIRPHFLFRLAEKENGRRRPKEKGRSLWILQRVHSTDFQRTAGAYRASSKGLCAFPDARPLTLMVYTAWQNHCLFDVMRQDDSEVQTRGICQPWGIKGGRARPQTAFWFLSSLRLRLFCVPRLTASCFCPFLLFTKRRKPQRGKEGKGFSCLKVFCAFPDAQPLIPAVPETWQSLWLFDAEKQDVSEDFQPFSRSTARYETGSDTARL